MRPLETLWCSNKLPGLRSLLQFVTHILRVWLSVYLCDMLQWPLLAWYASSLLYFSLHTSLYQSTWKLLSFRQLTWSDLMVPLLGARCWRLTSVQVSNQRDTKAHTPISYITAWPLQLVPTSHHLSLVDNCITHRILQFLVSPGSVSQYLLCANTTIKNSKLIS